MILYSYFQEKRRALFDYSLRNKSIFGAYFCHYILRYQVTINDFERFNTSSFTDSIIFKILRRLNPEAAASFDKNVNLLQKKIVDREAKEREEIIDEEGSLHRIHSQLMEYGKLIAERQSAIESKTDLLNHELEKSLLIHEEREERKDLEAMALVLDDVQQPTEVVDIRSLWQQKLKIAVEEIKNPNYPVDKFLDLIADGRAPLNFNSDGHSADFKNFIIDFFNTGLICIWYEADPETDMMCSKLFIKLNKQDMSLVPIPSVRNVFFGCSSEVMLKDRVSFNTKLDELDKDTSQQIEKTLDGNHFFSKYGVQVYSQLLTLVSAYVSKELQNTEDLIRKKQHPDEGLSWIPCSLAERKLKFNQAQDKLIKALNSIPQFLTFDILNCRRPAA